MKRYFYTPGVLIALMILLTAGCTVFFCRGIWFPAISILVIEGIVLYFLIRLMHDNARKVSFMFEAIENNDYSIHYSTHKQQPHTEQQINRALNRIIQLIFQAKAEAFEQEKYYELILNAVDTGIVVIDDQGHIVQSNQAALQLLGIHLFLQVHQLNRIHPHLETAVQEIRPGETRQVSFDTEKGGVNLSIRASEMSLRGKHVRLLAINDIRDEMEQNETEAWIRLTRVLTHEIMNSVTPITSLSDTLLELYGQESEELRNGLETIRTTGKGLIAFVESYRKFTHIPTPHPTLFYVAHFAERMVQLARHHFNYPNITIQVTVEPDDLILYADEQLIGQVVQNLLKNAMQAIGPEKPDGHIELRAYCNEQESIFLEVSNNGPAIPPDVAAHIFIPFFTTKTEGSGIGLSISRQIMRLSGGSITLHSDPAGPTTFTLRFP
ncbi:MAG: sensor histidine kinase [Parabacteroides sp.]